MPLVPAKCPDCGGAVQVDTSKKAAVCAFCNNAFVIQDAIENYNIHQEIKADNVTVYGATVPMEALLKKEPIYIRTKQDGQLRMLYDEMIQHYPQRYEGWWGKIRLDSRNFTELTAVDGCNNYWEQVQKSAPQDVLPELTKIYSQYQNKATQANLSQRLSALKKQEDELQHQIPSAEADLKNNKQYVKKELKRAQKQKNRVVRKRIFSLLVAVLFSVLGISLLSTAFSSSGSPLWLVPAGICFLIAISCLRSLFRMRDGSEPMSSLKERLDTDHAWRNDRIQNLYAQLEKVQKEIREVEARLKG